MFRNTIKQVTNNRALPVYIMALVFFALVGIAVSYIFTYADLYAPLLGIVVFAIALLIVWSQIPRAETFSHPFVLIVVIYGITYLGASLLIVFGNVDLLIGLSKKEGEHYLFLTLLLLSLGLLSMIWGYFIGVGAHIARRLPLFSGNVSRKRLLFVTVIYLIIGVALFWIYIQSTGGISYSLNDFTVKRRSNIGFVGLISSNLFNLVVLFAIIYAIPSKKRMVNPTFWIAIILSVLNSLLNSSRFELIVSLLIPLIAYHYLIRKFSVRFITIVAIFAVLVSFLIFSQRNRDSFSLVHFKESLEPVVVIENVFTHSGRFTDVTTATLLIRHVTESEELLAGRSFSDLVIRFVPRSLWPNKPEGLGDTLADLLYPTIFSRQSEAGVPPNLMPELFWNFHIPGLMIGMAVFGIFCRAIYELLLRAPANPWNVIIYSVSMSYIFSQLRSYFAAATSRYIIYLLLILPVIYFVNIRVVKRKGKTALNRGDEFGLVSKPKIDFMFSN